MDRDACVYKKTGRGMMIAKKEKANIVKDRRINGRIGT